MALLSGKISDQNWSSFIRPGFEGRIVIHQDTNGLFNALEVDLHTSHPEKTIQPDVAVRMYRIEEGSGTFTINGTKHTAVQGNVFIIITGDTYQYEGKMRLFEVNIFNK